MVLPAKLASAKCIAVLFFVYCLFYFLIPARASEQGGLSVYMSSKKIVIERTRGLIYLKLVAKDFFQKIISSSAGENAGDSV